MTRKITKATLKSFIRKNLNNLYINVQSEFDGMVDGCVSQKRGFVKVQQANVTDKNNLGVEEVYLSTSTRNKIREYCDGFFKGYEVSNCCGKFILAESLF